MKYYKLRVDTNNKELLKDLLIRYTEVYLIGLENGGTENPHCHVYMETTHKTDAIRMMIRKHYGSGNGSYSLKELDERQPIEYISYCLKENNFIHTLTPEFIQECKDWNTRVKEEIKTKKENKKTILQKIEEYYDYENVDPERWLIQAPKRQDIVKDVINYYKENNILVRQFQMISQIQTLKLKYEPSYAGHLYHMIIEKL